MERKQSELTVITKAKDLCSHLSFGHTYKLQKKVLGEFVLSMENKYVPVE